MVVKSVEKEKKQLTARQERIHQALEMGFASGAKIIMKPVNLVRERALEEIKTIIQKGS